MVKVIALVVLLVVFLVGMRTKSPAVVDGVRRINRAFTNPRVLRSAGTAGANAAIIRHVGRTSGRRYETPVGPFEVGDDIVIAMPYGMRADWVRNVLAAGTAELVHQGRTMTVTEPRVVPTSEVLDALPSGEQRTLSLFGVDSCLRLSVSNPEA
jgi:deazaflavin-dependent oxidoreductase (nitroreductase family)